MNLLDKFSLKNLNTRWQALKEGPLSTIITVLVCILVSIILVKAVILPQAENIKALTVEQKSVEREVRVVRTNLQTMKGIDANQLDQQHQVLEQGLPPEEDVVAIINAISAVALRMNIKLDDYTVQIGGSADPKFKDALYQQQSFNLKTGIDTAKQFAKEVEQVIPIAKVTSINGNSTSSTISFGFFYKKYPQITYNDTVPIKGIPSNINDTINTVNSWKDNVAIISSQSAVASISADPF